MKCSISKVLVVMIELLCCLYQAFGMNLVMENFEQTHGQDVLWMEIRARKYNRTTTVVNGTIHMYQEGTNDYQFNLDIFFSRLGNQQYNHLPIKLPSVDICDFIDYIYKNYPGYMSLFINGPKEGECPIKVRDIHVLDVEFPKHAIPQIIMREGYYKAVVTSYLHGKQVISYYTVLKATN
uniref:Uncharacterized protein n=1 Tax=Anopheles culicifacies TaxID=139723 RepID=A0A182MVE4_9DIPT